MSIREALERGPMDRQRRVMSRIDVQGSNHERFMEASRSIHRDAHVPELLNELKVLVRSDFPDARIKEKIWVDGSLYLELGWNFQSDSSGHIWYARNSISVGANPLSEDLVVLGKEAELLSRAECKSEPKFLEDAIVRAYQEPEISTRPPGRI